MAGRDFDGIMVEGSMTHDPLRAGIPGVVFPKGKQPSGPQCTPDHAQGIHAMSRHNVVKNAVAEGKIEVAGGFKPGKLKESRREAGKLR